MLITAECRLGEDDQHHANHHRRCQTLNQQLVEGLLFRASGLNHHQCEIEFGNSGGTYIEILVLIVQMQGEIGRPQNSGAVRADQRQVLQLATGLIGGEHNPAAAVHQ